VVRWVKYELLTYFAKTQPQTINQRKNRKNQLKTEAIR
jgi:hypothetical protein